MPPVIPNPNGIAGLAEVIRKIVREELSTFISTIPVKDQHGAVVALIGNLATDPQTGAATSITPPAFGIASKKTGTWVQL